MPGEVLLEVRAAGICGTDLHIEAGEYACGRRSRWGTRSAASWRPSATASIPALVGTRVVSETYYSHLRRVPLLPRRAHEPVPAPALDRLVRRRRVRPAGGGAGPRPASDPGLAAGRGGGDDRAAGVRLPVPVRPAGRHRRRSRAGDRPGPHRAARRADRPGAWAATCSCSACRPTPRGWRRRGSSASRQPKRLEPAGGVRRRRRVLGRRRWGRGLPGGRGPRGPLRAGRRVRQAGDRAARPRLRQGARGQLGIRLDAALLAAGADADRTAGGGSSSRWSARWYPSTRGSARSGICAREGA